MDHKVLVVVVVVACLVLVFGQQLDTTILSTSKNPPEGYEYAGALFEGTGYWSTAYNSNYPSSDFHALQYNNIMYFPAGQDIQGNMLGSTASYNPLLQQFNASALPLMPTPRSRYGATIINSTMYIAGGQLQETKGGDEIPTACVISFDLEDPAGSWNSDYACMQFNRSDFCLVNVQDTLYAVGGYNQFYEQLSTIERYDVDSDEWVTVEELDRGRGDVGCVAVNNTIYILGGVHANFDWSIEIQDWFLTEFVSFDVATNDLTYLANMTHARGDFGFVGLPNDRLLVMGGETHHKGERTQVAQHFVEEYVISQDVWIQKAPMDNPRFRFGAAYVENAVYVYGGHQTCDTEECAKTALSDIEVYVDTQHPTVFIHQGIVKEQNGEVEGGQSKDVDGVVLSNNAVLPGYSNMGSIRQGSGYWSRLPDMPARMSDFQVVVLAQQFLILGGLDEQNQVLDSVFIYDPILRTYSRFGSRMLEPRMRFAVAKTEDKIYVIGGYNTSDYGLQDLYGPAAQPMILDLQTGTWTFGNPLLTPRSDLCASAVNNTVFVMGGWPAGFTETLASIEYLEQEIGEWQQLASPLPTPRGDCQAVSILDEIVVLGGYYDPANAWNADSFRSEVEAYNTSTGQWQALAALPNARGDKSAVKLGEDRILVLGGETHLEGEATEVGTRYVEEYLREKNIWVQKAALPEAKFRAGAASLDGAVYLFGGHGVCPGETDCAATAMNTAFVYYDVSGSEFFIHTKN